MSQYNWDWGVVLQAVPDTDEYYWQWLLQGLGWTVVTSLSAWVIALILGTLIGTLRTLPDKRLAFLGTAWVELFRNIPLVVQLFLWFFVLPELLPERAGTWMKQSMPYPEFFSAAVGLGLFTSARVAEQVRTGIQTLSRGQKNAGLALGFTLLQTYRYVLLPMAFRIIMPPLTSEFMNVFKNSAVAFAIGLTELAFQMKHITSEYAAANVIEIMTYISILYLALAFSANRLMHWIEKRVAVPGYISGGK